MGSYIRKQLRALQLLLTESSCRRVETIESKMTETNEILVMAIVHACIEVSAETSLKREILCCLGLGLGCCWILFCDDDCKRTVHTCPNCNNDMATVNVF